MADRDNTTPDLNPDALEMIFRYLEPASIKAVSQVSR